MAGLLRSVTRQVYAARQGLAVSRTFAYSSYSGKNINDSANPDEPIWKGYKRRHKGPFPRLRTRVKCKRGDKVCGNPCPICSRDIEVHYEDAELLKQFICPHTDRVLEATVTGLCRQQQRNIEAAIAKARDYGVIAYSVPQVKESDQEDEDIEILPTYNRIRIRNINM